MCSSHLCPHSQSVKTALLLATLLALPSQDPKTVTLAYAAGGTVTAQVLGVEGGNAKLKIVLLGGAMEVTRPLTDFVSSSVFTIEREAAQPKTFDEHMRLAKRAAELDLVKQTGNCCRAAIAAVKDTPQAAEKRNEVRGWAASALEGMIGKAVSDGRLKDAQYYLQLLSTRLAEQRTEEQLEALAATVGELKNSEQQAQQAKRQEKLDADARVTIESRMKPIYKHLEAAAKKQVEAVRKSGKTVESSRLSEAAIALYKKAWGALQELVEKFPRDEELAREAEVLGAQMQADAIQAALHAATMLTVQSDYKGAREWVGKVLVLEPDNADAKAMMQTIIMAEADDGDIWDWGMRTVSNRPDPRQR